MLISYIYSEKHCLNTCKLPDIGPSAKKYKDQHDKILAFKKLPV